jgi:predicted nucleic acid-binding Zn ribbon protein
MEQNEEFIGTLRIESDHCEELGRNARTEEFADRVRERIEAKSQKISDLKRRNEELEPKIAEAEGRAAGNSLRNSTWWANWNRRG